MGNRILWVDDEADFLRPHIIFLENNGYKVDVVYSGEDALEMIQKNTYELIFLDQNMPGIDGLSLNKEIKAINPNINIVMITKTQDIDLINSAIGANIDDFIVKPINSYQLLSIVKKYIDSWKIKKDSLISNYTMDYPNLDIDIYNSTFDDWVNLYLRVIHWDTQIIENNEEEIKQMHEEKKRELNDKFTFYIIKNYLKWINDESEDAPTTSVDIFVEYIEPYLEVKKKVFFLLLDCLRLDQWIFIKNILKEKFIIKDDYYLSLLPSSTPFSRNAIFAGLYPIEIFRRHPEIWDFETEENMGMNTYEEELFSLQLKLFGYDTSKMKFLKIYSNTAYHKMFDEIKTYADKYDIIAAVFTFIDKLSHEIRNSSILIELVNDEYGYVNLTKAWFEASILRRVIEYLGEKGFTIIVTTDHGSVWGKRPLKIEGGRNISRNLRYKHGSVFYTDTKKAFIIERPEEYKLPVKTQDFKYVLATNDYYFVYPSNYNIYKKYYQNSIYHGGISMEELILPISILEYK